MACWPITVSSSPHDEVQGPNPGCCLKEKKEKKKYCKFITSWMLRWTEITFNCRDLNRKSIVSHAILMLCFLIHNLDMSQLANFHCVSKNCSIWCVTYLCPMAISLQLHLCDNSYPFVGMLVFGRLVMWLCFYSPFLINQWNTFSHSNNSIRRSNLLFDGSTKLENLLFRISYLMVKMYGSVKWVSY